MNIGIRNKILFETKKEFLEDLYFYYQLSDDNIMFDRIKKITGYDIKNLSKYIDDEPLNENTIEKINVIYREVFNIKIKAIVENEKVFIEKYFIGE